jgi:Chaperone of endosialidase
MTLIPKPNSFVSVETGTNQQLSYGLQLNPAPFTVSVPNEDPVLGSLEFVITNPTATALSVNSVAFTLQVGTGASITPSTGSIATAVSDPTDWIVVGPPSPVTSGPATYTLQPATGSSVSLASGASVVVQIFQIQTNPAPGNSTINIKEIVGNQVGLTSFMVTTFPAGFYLDGLAVNVQSGGTFVPVAQVTSGTAVTLTWNSSVVDTGAFVIYYSSASQGQQTTTPTTLGEWTTPTPLTSDTVFTVVVTVSMAGGQPLTASLSTAVAVQNPSLIAASINTGQATVTGAASINGPLTASAINGTSLAVTGSASVASLTANGPINASGQASLGSGSISGTLAVTGQTTLSSVSAQAVNTGSINVSGNAAISGGITATNAQIQVGQNFGVTVADAFTYNNQRTGWYSIGWFNDPWFPYGPTAWFSGYGGFKFFSGGATPAFTIDYNGNCVYTGSMSKASSIALKENIRSLTANEASHILNNLEPVQYTRKAAPDERPSLGFIAEHVPSAVASADGKAIVPDEIVAVLTRVVKDQQQVIEKLERKVSALEAKNGASSHRGD